MKKYRKNANSTVIAVQVNLVTSGFTYEKWGAAQQCKPGDWIVNNNGDTYTVDQQSFAKTYHMQSPGIFFKTTPVWAQQVTQSGSIKTKEGESHYQAGDYLIYNNADGSDGYCISKAKFEAMYELDQ